MDEDVIIPVVLFLMIGAPIMMSVYYRYKNRADLQTTIRLALDKGNELTPELLDRMAGPKHSATTDLRRGLIWLSLGISCALFGIILGEPDAMRPIVGSSSFPLLVGLAYLVMFRYGDREGRS